MAIKNKMLAPLSAAVLAAYATPNTDAATTILPGSYDSNVVLDQLVGLASDNGQVRVYGDDNLHYFTRDLTSTGQTGTQNSLEDAMVYSTTLDGATSGNAGFDSINITNGSGEFTRGFAGGTQTRALHGVVNIGGVDYTLATTNDGSGNLTTAWYNNTNAGLGPVAQTIDIAPMMSELGISTADQITGGALYLADGGDANNLNHYIPLWNSEDKIAQFNPTNGFLASYDTGADGLQDVHVQGNDIYTVDALAPGIGSVNRHAFGAHIQSISVPEPSSVALLGLTGLGALVYRRRE